MQAWCHEVILRTPADLERVRTTSAATLPAGALELASRPHLLPSVLIVGQTGVAGMRFPGTHSGAPPGCALP